MRSSDDDDDEDAILSSACLAILGNILFGSVFIDECFNLRKAEGSS